MVGHPSGTRMTFCFNTYCQYSSKNVLQRQSMVRCGFGDDDSLKDVPKSQIPTTTGMSPHALALRNQQLMMKKLKSIEKKSRYWNEPPRDPTQHECNHPFLKVNEAKHLSKSIRTYLNLGSFLVRKNKRKVGCGCCV